jgi:hypothetical protein
MRVASFLVRPSRVVFAAFGTVMRLVLDAVPPSISLLVSVSVVARPTRVSVEVGRVNVPVLEIVEMTGEVRVLLVRVCAVSTTTIVSAESITSGIVIVIGLVPVCAAGSITTSLADLRKISLLSSDSCPNSFMF